MRWFGLIGLLASAVASPALANDSTAELSTGGLAFVHSDSVEMQSEDLFLSTEQVRVHYQFLNTSKADVTTLVAFPMPDIIVDTEDFTTNVPSESQENILDFHTLADGKPVPAQVQQHVFAFGVDRTEMLRQLHIPLGPHLTETGKALDALPQSRWDEFLRLGLAEISEYDVGKGMQKHLSPRWTLKTTYFWEQTFPAGRVLTIDHSYKPSVGGSVQAMLGADYAKTDPHYPEYLKKYCVTPDLRKAVERAVAAGGANHPIVFTEQRMAYVLMTANNWNGPIKNFRLVVDRGDPKALVSFCGDNVKKISPTQFEMRKTDFSPEQDLNILFLLKSQS